MAFVRAAAVQDVPPGTIRAVEIQGKTIAVANVDGKFFAINNVCAHVGGPVSEGPLAGKIVTCPWHGWEYDVMSGKVCQDPSVGVESYRVEVRNQEIFIDVN